MELGPDCSAERTPRRRKTSLMVNNLHEVTDIFAVRQNLGQVLSAKDVAQRRLCEQPSGPMRILDVSDRNGGV